MAMDGHPAIALRITAGGVESERLLRQLRHKPFDRG
jgi:hypothetical protein